MADYQKIEYRIGQDGQVTEVVLNGEGSQCVSATVETEAALGTVVQRDLLPEFSQEGDDEVTRGMEQSVSAR